MTFVASIDAKETLIEFLPFEIVDLLFVEGSRRGAEHVVDRSIDPIAVHRRWRERTADGETTLPDRSPCLSMFVEQSTRGDRQGVEEILFRFVLQGLLPVFQIGAVQQRGIAEDRRRFDDGENRLVTLTKFRESNSSRSKEGDEYLCGLRGLSRRS